MADLFKPDRREFLLTGTVGSVAMLLASPAHGAAKPTHSHASAADGLAKGFRKPPHAAKPQTWWHWMDGNVTREGITADLEAMQRIGLGGVQIFNVSYQIPFGQVRYMTPEWLQMMRHAANECARLGLEMGMHNCSGWSSSGGPWITPDIGMKKLVWSETTASGGAPAGRLPRPACGKYDAYYRDIAVLACKNPAQEGPTLAAAGARISTGCATWPASPPPVWPGAEPPFPVSSDPVQDYGAIAAHLDITLPGPTQAAPQFVLIETPKPFRANALFLAYRSSSGNATCEVQVSDDGVQFRTVASTPLGKSGQPTIAFPAVASRFFRILFVGRDEAATLRLLQADLVGGYRLPEWSAKAGFAQMENWAPAWDDAPPDDMLFRSADIVDVSRFMAADGTLDWTAPEGRWTILRFGYAPNGRPNTHPEEPSGVGLEIDKLSKAALDVHFQNMTEVVTKAMGALSGKAFTNLLIDSYEVGPQNWTEGFETSFRRRAGYDLIPFLPLFTGRAIDSVDTAERVLWDVRKVIADLFAENYYGYFGELCHRYGLKAASEPYGGPYSIMDCAAGADLPMSEFWTGTAYTTTNARTRMVASAAHLGSRSVVGAEAFTSGFYADRFSLSPFDLKALGDFQFTEGINQFIFHRFAHQPWTDKAPGMTMGPWGLHFDRTQTWWKQAADYIGYVSRAQYLLQAGKPVADILAFAGEDGSCWPHWGDQTVPPVPAGYDFEFVNAQALARATVKDGKIVLGNGLVYRLLILPDATHMTLDLVKTLHRLIEAGAVVSAPRPTRSPHFAPQTLAETYAAAVAAVWGDASAAHSGYRTLGLGRLYGQTPPVDILADLGLAPDFAIVAADTKPHIVFKHRQVGETGLYFVSNQNDRAVSVEAAFRVSGAVPQLWHPDSGIIEPAPIYSQADGIVRVPLTIGPSGSLFVVFKPAKVADHAVAIAAPSAADYRLIAAPGGLRLTAATAGSYTITTATGRHMTRAIAPPPPDIELDDDWQVSFPPNLGAPRTIVLPRLASLSVHGNAGVRYFSGSCTYRRDVHVPAEMLEDGNRIVLDLGVVAKLARLRVNNRDFGTLWHPPFRTDITKALKPGRNRLIVEVTNVWANRLIGDEQLEDDCEWIAIPGRGWRLKAWPQWLEHNRKRPSGRIAFSTWRFYDKDAPLPESGLIGPVRLCAWRSTTFR